MVNCLCQLDEKKKSDFFKLSFTNELTINFNKLFVYEHNKTDKDKREIFILKASFNKFNYT